MNRKLAIGLAVLWLLLWCDWSAWHWLPTWAHAIGFLAGIAGMAYWFSKVRQEHNLVRCVAGTALFIVLWHGSIFLCDWLNWGQARAFLARGGIVVFFLTGLAWVVYYVERRTREVQTRVHAAVGPDLDLHPAVVSHDGRIWNPFDLGAWYYRSHHRKLDQSLWTLIAYVLGFLLLFLILTRLSGCREIYEMPAGGGEQEQIQKVKIQKIIEKKIVINPFSSIVFNPPPIEDIKLQFQELTKHAYKVGYGEGKGAGFAGGTQRGKVRFIRLEYTGGDWDQDFGVGSDLNMLLEYGIRTGHKVHDRTESRRIQQLENFPKGKSPPVVYMTGQKNIIVNDKEVEILREYLLDKHGMIFADNGGSSGWHGRFFGLMDRVLPKVKPVRIPLDHPVHMVPYQIPFLPYVAPHGGKDAWGWVVDGRLVCYYHPGDIGDAWADGHAGVKREIWEYCYQLGTNIIFYGHAEYNKWLDLIQEQSSSDSSER